MAAPSPSVIGDFVVAWGAQTADWVAGLDGFSVITKAGEPAQAAVRGAVRHGQAENGARWVAQADLIGGSVEESLDALEPGAPATRDRWRGWRGRFAVAAWNPGERTGVALSDHFSTLSLY